MIRTYLSNNFVRFFWLIFLLTIWLRYWWSFLILIFFGYLVFGVFRKKVNKKVDLTSNRFMAPVYGQVVNIFFKPELSRIGIKLVLPSKQEYGLYLPMQGEIINIERHKSQRGWRFTKNFKNILKKGTVFSMKSGNNVTWEFQLIPCWFGLKPILYVLNGDSGKSGANLGFFPFGGSVVVYLPNECKVMVKAGDLVRPHETVLATL